MIVTLKNTAFTARIDSLGAQLISLRQTAGGTAAGTEYIWQRDPAYWKSCSPLLFPSVGLCRNGKTLFGGQWYEMPKHGICRNAEFTVSQTSDTCASFTLRDSEDSRTHYPFSFCLTLRYTLTADGIHMDYQVENTGEETMYYEIGAHPGFNCPLKENERFEDYVLEFEQEETLSSMPYDLTIDELVAERRIPQLDHSRVLPLRYDLFENDAVFFEKPKSRKVALKNSTTGKGVEVSFPDFETVAFWTPMPGKGPLLCIEPWNGSDIRTDEDDQFEHRHFIQVLAPGEKKPYHVGIRVL